MFWFVMWNCNSIVKGSVGKLWRSVPNCERVRFTVPLKEGKNAEVCKNYYQNVLVTVNIKQRNMRKMLNNVFFLLVDWLYANQSTILN